MQGKLTTNPIEKDEIARSTWEDAFQGTIEDHEMLVQNFCMKYAKLIYEGDEAPIQGIDRRELKEVCCKAGGGWGFVTSGENANLNSVRAMHWLG